MGFRFRKSITIVPGLRVNLGKKGASLSVGGRGATINLSKKGARATVGIPGTGISYTENLSEPLSLSENTNSIDSRNSSTGNPLLGFAFIAFILWVLYKVFHG